MPLARGAVPATLPALLKAQRTQEKAARVGFDWKGKEFHVLTADTLVNQNRHGRAGRAACCP